MRGLREAVLAAVSNGADTLCIVAHGGTIMAAMSGLTGGEYLSFNAPNGAGYIIELETDDAGNVTAATSYDRFLGGLRDGSSGWRSPEYTPPGSMGR
jgi:broad specificity phosphatase PhoE